MAKLSFIIPCLNSEKTIGRTLDAILTCSTPDKEVIVVDNGSTDKTVELATRSGVKVIHCEKRGAGTARNFGAKHASGTYLAFIDSDTVIESDWAEVLLEAMEEKPYSASLGKVIPAGEDSFLTGYRKNLAARRYQGTNISLYHFRGMSPVINTAACIFRRSVFEAIGGFEERLSRYEDTEIAWRLFNYGGVVFGSHFARAHVYNSAGPMAYLKRSYLLGLSRRSLGSLVRYTEAFTFHTVLVEFFAEKLLQFSFPEIIFYYLNYFSFFAGFVVSLKQHVPLPLALPMGLRRKILSIFTIGKHHLSDDARLVVVDDEMYFFLVKGHYWKMVRREKLKEQELEAEGFLTAH